MKQSSSKRPIHYIHRFLISHNVMDPYEAHRDYGIAKSNRTPVISTSMALPNVIKSV